MRIVKKICVDFENVLHQSGHLSIPFLHELWTVFMCVLCSLIQLILRLWLMLTFSHFTFPYGTPCVVICQCCSQLPLRAVWGSCPPLCQVPCPGRHHYWPSRLALQGGTEAGGSREGQPGEGRKEGARASTDLFVPHPSGQQFSQQKARVHTGDLWLCVALLREFHWPLDFPLLLWLKGVLKLLNPFPVLLLGCKEVLKRSKLGKIYFWFLWCWKRRMLSRFR